MKIVLLLVLLLSGIMAKGQISSNESIKVDIDVFISKDIVNGTELAKCVLLNDIDVSSSQALVLASNNCFFCVGYGNYVSRKIKGKKISSFCVVGNDVYYSEKSNLYKAEGANWSTKVTTLSFTPRKLWSGKKEIYAVCKKGKNDDVYVISPDKKEMINFFSTSKPVVSIDEYKSLIFILTENSIVMISIKEKKYEEFPVNLKETGKLLSMAIDQANGIIYLSATNGVYRVYDNNFQKICRDIGILCYDVEGMMLFNNKDPFVLRLRNSLLYPEPQGVVIEIK